MPKNPTRPSKNDPDGTEDRKRRDTPPPADGRPADDTHDTNLDRTIEESFPASDPPSTIPDPDTPDPDDQP